MDAAISVRNVTLRHGDIIVVTGLDLEVPQGMLFGLVGPSGSGKTTIMRTMLGLRALHSGDMQVLGLHAGHRDGRQRIGYLPQSGGNWLDLTARESLRFMARIYDVDPARIAGVIDLLEIGHCADRPIATLSGGEERRVGLAMAVLHHPELLILDEPTVGLDPRLRHKLWTEFRAWAAAGTTLLVSTHVMAEAEECDRVAVLVNGRIVTTDTPLRIKERLGSNNMDDAVLRLLEREGGDVS
jgi:ABC-2 type transport system ATP-binding protein